MSRIGKKLIAIPKGVKVDVQPGAVEVQGPKGKLRQALPAGHRLRGRRRSAARDARCARIRELGKFHGLARSLVANAVARRHRRLPQGPRHRRRRLPRRGQGQAGASSRSATRTRWCSTFRPGIDIAIDKQTHITVTGIDRQAVGQVAANIRRLRKPDPYKQKGVRYTGEVLKKKAGKTGAK